jgi:hypothetical protein
MWAMQFGGADVDAVGRIRVSTEPLRSTYVGASVDIGLFTSFKHREDRGAVKTEWVRWWSRHHLPVAARGVIPPIYQCAPFGRWAAPSLRLTLLNASRINTGVILPVKE